MIFKWVLGLMWMVVLLENINDWFVFVLVLMEVFFVVWMDFLFNGLMCFLVLIWDLFVSLVM